MKRNIGSVLFVLLLALIFVSGCAKKAVLKEETAAPKESVVTEVKPAVPEKKITDDGEARRRAAREQAERDAALKAQAERDAAAKALAEKEAAAKKKAKKEASVAVAAKELYEFADVYFDYDKTTLKEDARETLKKHADWLNKNGDVKVIIEGHCDERGTAEYNLALGERRAKAAARYLSDLGVSAQRISTISYGFERPLDPRHNEEAWAKNRRAHFVASGTK